MIFSEWQAMVAIIRALIIFCLFHMKLPLKTNPKLQLVQNLVVRVIMGVSLSVLTALLRELQ